MEQAVVPAQQVSEAKPGRGQGTNLEFHCHSVVGAANCLGQKMNDTIYLLWFVQKHQEDDDAELLIGVYDSEAAAKAASESLQGQPGFVDFPERFQIQPA
jgi:hypothetical protein